MGKHYSLSIGDALRLDSQKLVRWRKADLEELHLEMKSELKRMEDLRKEGKLGRLDFDLKKVRGMLSNA